MRFAELQLLAYGHFTDRRLELAPGHTDLHLIHGANEAGKSTARNAVAHFLFGFPLRAERAAFIHNYRDLRIGARLDTGDETIEAVRKKGNKNTVLDSAGQADAEREASLARELAGVDDAFFTRMFSLDHAALRAGGRQLAAADTGADTALIAAGSGLADVAAARTALAAEADALWSPNRSKHRAYYQAADRLAAAEAEIREHAVTVGDWQRQRDALAAAQAHYDELTARRADLQRQYREIERIRRVAPPVRRYRELSDELAELADTPVMAAEARETFDTARAAIHSAEAAEADINQRIAAIDEELAGLTDAPALRAQAETIDRLAGRRAQIAEDREREAELARANDALTADLEAERERLAAAGVIAPEHWPEPAAIDAVRRLAGQYGALAQRQTHAADDLARLAEEETATRREAERLGRSRDTAALAAWQAAATRNGDLELEAQRAHETAAAQDRDISRRLAELVPSVANVEALAAMRPPDRASVEAAERDLTTARQACQRHADHVAQLTDDVTRERDALARRRADTQLPDRQTLVALRAHRDAAWRLVQRRYIEGRGADLFDDEADLDPAARRDPVAAVARLTDEADTLADARFDAATAIAADAQSARHLAEREQALAQAHARLTASEQTQADHEAAWEHAWADAELVPGTPATMRAWLAERQQILDAHATRDDALSRAAALEQTTACEHAAGRAHLTALGVDETSLKDTSLAALVERARRVIAAEQRRDEAIERVTTSAGQQFSRRRQLVAAQQDAETKLARWRDDWRAAMARLALDPDLAVDTIDTPLDALAAGQAHAHGRAVNEREQADIRDRRRRFADALAGVINATGHAVNTEDTPEHTAASVADALDAARRAHQIRLTREADREADEKRAATQAKTRQQARARLDELAAQAATADLEALDQIITRADRRRAAEREQAEARQAIARQGDDKAVDTLIAAAEASDADTLAEQVDTLDTELADLETRIGTARDERNAAYAAFDAIGGDERAVIAAGARQTALADMTRAAERYLRSGLAALLLKWAGQRYALDKHATLLARSSTLIQRLTGGSVVHLAGEFDDNDELAIVGVRADGAHLPTTAMSEGTLDQLYLALRIAAIEDYLTRAAPLPVIADDLFINFDDERAMAGLDALAELSHQTQVLFFTHHAHLKDMATERLGDHVCIHEL